MPTLTIDADDLFIALEDHTPDIGHFLDCATGAVIPIALDTRAEFQNPADPGERARVLADPERYRRIETIPTWRSWEMMSDFIETVPDMALAHQLAQAIDGKGAFRRFKDTLARYPAARQAWFQYHEQVCWRYAQEWLEAEGVEAELRWRSPLD